MLCRQGAVIVVIIDEPRESCKELLRSLGEIAILGYDGIEVD
jgi:hypothetical protein